MSAHETYLYTATAASRYKQLVALCTIGQVSYDPYFTSKYDDNNRSQPLPLPYLDALPGLNSSLRESVASLGADILSNLYKGYSGYESSPWTADWSHLYSAYYKNLCQLNNDLAGAFDMDDNLDEPTSGNANKVKELNEIRDEPTKQQQNGSRNGTQSEACGECKCSNESILVWIEGIGIGFIGGSIIGVLIYRCVAMSKYRSNTVIESEDSDPGVESSSEEYEHSHNESDDHLS